ncbi:serine O-acetyltransferase [Roseiarcus fermentans]|uniref:serine O-acetyltransferase n=1 Tax=Roseiarcus fermentans TaxID=1473586 RepID=A0A366F5G6_9HYPH|nr:serine O-acetyltransferase [Roseiarcus fermentans]
MTALRDDRPGGEADLDLARVAARLHALRMASQTRRYRGAPPALPSRDTIVEIVENLVAALYPRHFGPPALAPERIDAFVIRTLEAVLSALRRQIELELALAREWKGESRIDSPLRAGDIVEAFAEALPKVRRLLDSDLKAAFEGDPSAKSIDEIVFCFPGFAAIARHRLAHELYTLGVTMIARIVAEEAHSATGIDIHPGATIGERFFIDHGTGVVIGETAIIGRNVRLYQAVTLGAKRFEADASGALAKNYPRHPIVEDDVVIYAGATVLGRVTIGRGSSIGGNVWLTRDVPPGSSITQAKARNETFDDGAGI